MSVLERGDVHFFFRPKVETERPRSLRDVQRFHLVLHPFEVERYRLIAMGRKRLPERGERLWAFVDLVRSDPAALAASLRGSRYMTKTRGERHQPAARPVGKGMYAIAAHDRHVHLAYSLELPREPGEPQAELVIEERASFVVAVMNPEVRYARARFPAELQQRFEGRRFAPLAPEHLDHEGAELVFVGAGAPPAEIGEALEPEREDEAAADLFRFLAKAKASVPTRSLLEGTWASEAVDEPEAR